MCICFAETLFHDTSCISSGNSMFFNVYISPPQQRSWIHKTIHTYTSHTVNSNVIYFYIYIIYHKCYTFGGQTIPPNGLPETKTPLKQMPGTIASILERSRGIRNFNWFLLGRALKFICIKYLCINQTAKAKTGWLNVLADGTFFFLFFFRKHLPATISDSPASRTPLDSLRERGG